ncbi:DUF4097 family beta strand repeat-containing protein [Bacillus sp. 2205SS5-2]|uniref:DUF4097 family beta strand repeat-containing protein n=1 Tax=Bacillus sp. 2205SS5-2 TaxID=3109031 RepID=UPI00300458CF
MALKDIFSLNVVPIKEDASVEGKQIRNISVQGSSMDVNVLPSDKDNIDIKLRGEVSERVKDHFNLQVKQVNDFLSVEMERKKFSAPFGVIVVRLTLDLFIPKKIYESLLVKTSSGEIELHLVKSKNIELKTSSGDIRVKDIEETEAIKLSASSGDMILTGGQARFTQLETSSGDIIMRKFGGSQLEASSSSGKIDICGYQGNLHVESSSGDINLLYDELTGHLKAKTSSGSVKLSYQIEPSSFNLDFKGSSGEADIHVKGIEYEKNTDHVVLGTKGAGDYSLQVRTSSGDFLMQ